MEKFLRKAELLVGATAFFRRVFLFFDGAKIWKRFDLSKYYRNIFWRELHNVFFYNDKNKAISRVLLFSADF